eukprot:2787380-Prymnesium_polylepis.1
MRTCVPTHAFRTDGVAWQLVSLPHTMPTFSTSWAAGLLVAGTNAAAVQLASTHPASRSFSSLSLHRPSLDRQLQASATAAVAPKGLEDVV